MKLKLDDLGASLSQGLLPIYLISGDEPLLVGEALDQIRTMARDNGYLERELHVAERGFDWAGLLANTGNLSLFAERRIIDLRLPTGKPGDGSKMIAALAEQPPEDTLVLISAPKLESSQLSSKWVKAIDKAGAIVRIWPIEAGALPGWINNRLRRQGLNASRDAVLQLARRVEGNLLAAKQEIDRLALECTGGELGVDDVENTVADSTRYTIFKLADEALAGRTPRALRMLAGLQREGLAPVQPAWALSRESRQLAAMTQAMDDGLSLSQCLAQWRIWRNRMDVYRAALTRLNADKAAQLVSLAERTDRAAKGQADDDAWRLMRHWVVALGADQWLPLKA